MFEYGIYPAQTQTRLMPKAFSKENVSNMLEFCSASPGASQTATRSAISPLETTTQGWKVVE